MEANWVTVSILIVALFQLYGSKPMY